VKGTQSLWLATVHPVPKPTIQSSGHYDVLIVGGGIVGISTAYFLRESGLKISVVEAKTLLGDVTGHTTGKLTSQHGLIYRHTIDAFDLNTAQQYANMNQWAIEEVNRISTKENIHCDYTRDSSFVYATTDKTADEIRKELEACLQLSLPASISEPDLPFETKAALRFENQARYHPAKFLSGLVDSLSGTIQFFENSRVHEVEEKDGVCNVVTEHGKVTANNVVIATHYPIYDSGMFVAKLAPYKSYAIAVEVKTPMPQGMYITEDEPMRSLRRQHFEGREIQIVGGGHHKVGQEEDTAKCFSELARWADETFGVSTLHFKWSTQDNWSIDRLPYIGKMPKRDRIFLATGFGGWGMTTGIASGKILSDSILGIDNEWAASVDPGRMPLAAVPAAIKENLNAAGRLISDRLMPAESPEFSAIPIGGAAVVQLEDERVCAYRDPEGAVHAVTSACTHWGCELRWNSAEATWDCPCHGSRFSIHGEVLHGPAVKPLERRTNITDTE
jgi:glycine/D-amino acid oxidase-like deaminating enzyme/nitrite reductase/ring-hydroxylating ferredoxin subunit